MRGSNWLALTVVMSCAPLGCGGDPAPIDAATTVEDDAQVALDAPGTDTATREEDAPAATGTLVRASEGGVVRSEDGLFELWLGPDAIEEDTTISIARVERADLPTDLASLSLATQVYALEPDGLAFAEGGAFAHFILTGLPEGVARGASFVALARARDAGPVERIEATTTLSPAPGRMQILHPLRHLSYHAVENVFGCMDLELDLGDEIQTVGRPWRTRFVRARVGPYVRDEFLGNSGPVEEFVASAGVARLPPVSVDLLDGFGSGVDSLLGMNLPGFLESVELNHTNVGDYVAEARSQPLVILPLGGGEGFEGAPDPANDYRFVCTRPGVAEIFLGARAQYANPPAGALDFFHRQCQAFIAQPILCIEEPPLEVRVIEERTCRRQDDVVVCLEGAMRAQAALRERTHGVGSSQWTLRPFHNPSLPIDLPTITATSGGATMTATPDASGSYDATIDLPLSWDPASDTAWTASSGGTATTRGTPMGTGLPFHYGAVLGLDTDIVIEDESIGLVEVSWHAAQRITCDGESFDAWEVSGIPEIVDLGDGTRGYDAPLRDLVDELATHCEIAPAALTAGEFFVEVGVRERAILDAPSGAIAVSTGRAQTIDGASLLATCGGTRPTFCSDRCVDTAADPMNCGGCGVVGVETCDGTDDDCDGFVDNGCPTTIVWPVGIAETSPLFGDTMSASTGTGGSRGAVFNPYIGICGTTSSDGTIRTMLAMLGGTALRRTGTDTFELDIIAADNTTCADTTRAPSGGMVFRAECPAGMVADGVSGQAPMTGQIGQLTVSCARWGVMRDVTRRWVIRRTERAMSMPAGTGPGLPFSFMPLDDATTDNPPALRYLRSTYRSSAPMMMPGGVLWFQVGAVSPELR